MVGGTGQAPLDLNLEPGLASIHRKCVIPGKLDNLSEAALFTNSTYLWQDCMKRCKLLLLLKKGRGGGGGERREQDRSVHIFFNENENLHLPFFPWT